MTLAANVTVFAKELHRLENPYPKTPEEGALRFADAYIRFLENAMAGPVPINPAPLADPVKRELLAKRLTIAFKAKTGAAFSLALQNAIVTYLNAQTAAVLFSSATSFLFAVPLQPFLIPALSTPTKDGLAAKIKFSGKFYNWKQANQIIFPSSPSGIGPQFWV